MDKNLEKLKVLVAKKFLVNTDEISEDTFFGYLMDDITVVSDFIIHDVGPAFKIEIPSDCADEVNTVGELYELIKPLL
jgi:acyl carrier protein